MCLLRFRHKFLLLLCIGYIAYLTSDFTYRINFAVENINYILNNFRKIMFNNSLIAFRFTGGEIELRNPINLSACPDHAYTLSLKDGMSFDSFLLGTQIASDVCLRGNEAKSNFFKYIKSAENLFELPYAKNLEAIISSITGKKADLLFNFKITTLLGYGNHQFIRTIKNKKDKVNEIESEINKVINNVSGLNKKVNKLIDLCDELILESRYVRLALWHKLREYNRENDLSLDRLEDWIDIVEGISYQFNCLSELSSDLKTIKRFMVDLGELLVELVGHPKNHKKAIVADFFQRIMDIDSTGFAKSGIPNHSAFDVNVGGEVTINGDKASEFLLGLRERIKSSSLSVKHMKETKYDFWFADLPKMDEHRVRYMVKR